MDSFFTELWTRWMLCYNGLFRCSDRTLHYFLAFFRKIYNSHHKALKWPWKVGNKGMIYQKISRINVSCNMKIVTTTTSAHKLVQLQHFSIKLLCTFTQWGKTQFCFPQTIREATDTENRQVNCSSLLLYFFRLLLTIWLYLMANFLPIYISDFIST